MAIYHCQIRNLSRGAGQSTTSCLSYQTGEKIYDERTGLTKNCRHDKGGVVYKNTILPENSPERYHNPCVLTNEFEMNEKRSDASLGKHIIVALPREYNLQQSIDVVEDFAQNYFVKKGFAATYAIHDDGEGNPHAHILIPGRPLDKNGKWTTAKSKKICALDENGNKIPLIDPETGQQKVRMRPGKGAEKLWKTKTVSSDPLNGRKNYKEIRKAWETSVNKYLSPEQQVDCRSYKDRGIEIEPLKHESANARALAEKGETVEVIEENKRIRQRREEIKILDEKIGELSDYIDSKIYEARSLRSELHKRIANAFEKVREAGRNLREKVSEKISEFRLAEHFYTVPYDSKTDLYVFKYSDDNLKAMDAENYTIQSEDVILESDDQALNYIYEITGRDAYVMTDAEEAFYKPIFDEREVNSETVPGKIDLTSDYGNGCERTL